MCCEHGHDSGLPAALRSMLAEYEDLAAATPFDWGGELYRSRDWWFLWRYTDPANPFATWHDLVTGVGRDDWVRVFRDSIGTGEPPPDVVLVDVSGGELVVRHRTPGYVIEGSRRLVAVVVTGGGVSIDGVAVDGLPLPALHVIEVDWDSTVVEVAWGALVTPVVVGEKVATAWLDLDATTPARWGVDDDRGGAWFADGALEKWDRWGRPYFHRAAARVAVPSVELTVRTGRGMEFAVERRVVHPAAGEVVPVVGAPPRRWDAAARGWWGGDLHTHLNYSGDVVAHPHHAAAMQDGEALHVMNLVAANFSGARIYDRAALAATVGEDLPWSTPTTLARWGVEFRNDLLGHVHAFAPTAEPQRFHTGFRTTDHPWDWPPNAVACGELRDLGATVGYTHPVMAPLEDGSPSGAFQIVRSCEARELVADAALGLVDCVDLLGPGDAGGSVLLYRHLLGCGLRLAATAGTDVFVSFARALTFSNPPGWARAYADLRGEPLTADAWQRAVRAGRTFATNGPWIGLTARRTETIAAIGDTLSVRAGDVVDIVVTYEGVGATELELAGSDGTLVTVAVDGESAELATTVRVDGAAFVVAAARGPAHEEVLDRFTVAHTSPIWLDVPGSPVGRSDSVAWCLDWLARCRGLFVEHGNFADAAQRDDLLALFDQAESVYRAVPCRPADDGAALTVVAT